MKKMLSVMLALLMVFGGVMTAFGAESAAPADVQGTSYEEAVKALLEANVVSGYKDGTYRPANTLTRAEACAFLVNYLAPTADELKAAADSGFSDVKGWATTYVNYAVEKGIVTGYKDGTFRPSNQVTYQEMAAMTVNALGIDPKTLTGSWPNNYVNKAKELGMYENISVSKANGDKANRGDVAEMIYSLIKSKTASASERIAAQLAESQKALENMESISYEMVMDMNLSADGESVDMTSKMNLDMILDPLAMYMTGTVNSAGTIQEVEYYYVTEGSDLIMYMEMEGEWYKMSMGDVNTYLENSDPTNGLDMYLEAFDTIRIEGQDVVLGKPATKIYCELSDAYIEEALQTVGVLSQSGLELGDATKDMMENVIGMMKGFGYEMWVDNENGQLVKVRMDMTELMGSIMSEVMKAAAESDPEAAEEAGSVTIGKVVVEMIVSGINTVKEINLPAEAKDAVDIMAGM